ncbi:MAG TPA: tetratricopeptide repeat protein [Trichormus sp. M33_DOE_039]|nr:tetratricopeptide repeat protein [Trichormus sp. M33_DOE_039]
MQMLHLDLKRVDGNYVELRYFIDNPNQYEKRSLSLAEIEELINWAERDYYVSAFAEDYTVTGRKLYNWLDGSDRWLQSLLNQYRCEGIVLAIATDEKLTHLPWEVLHDDESFLVQRVPAIVPVRWVSDSAVKKLTVEEEPENRVLQVLFMATSPLNVEPVLDFEAEEARILQATAQQPLALTVEESGCLSELANLVKNYGKNYFDVVHLTGHATLQDKQPRFITETPTGEAYYATAKDIAQELQFQRMKLIFLSGCRTGQADDSGSVPSMAEELLKYGAKAVLGWGQKVLDHDATAAAAALYQELSAGEQITEALAITYQTLIKKKARDWHLLRLYTAANLPSSLVTPLWTEGRKPAPPPSVTTQFLDSAGKVKVPTRESFVGRRRQLQSCLRVLSPPINKVGVLIYGMGGLGKSSLAARLCDRLPNFERIVWEGRIDEASLVSRLAEKLDDNEQRKSLEKPDEELKYRLKRVFFHLHKETKPFLLVLDDFEVNLESRNESYVPQAEAAEVLRALVWAISENYTSHRIIITCRYDFEFTQLQHFHKQPLDALQGADLQKKFNLLAAFSAKSQVDEALKSQAQKLADGNPRLLEWLDKILQNPTVDQAAILNRMAAETVKFRENILVEVLLQQIDTTMREILSRGLVFELPVPREALAAVCETIPNLEDYINRAVALGLLAVSHNQTLRVPHILLVQLPTDAEALYKQAAEVLYRLWWENPQVTEEQKLEIHRLAVRGKAKNVLLEVTISLVDRWLFHSSFRKAVQLCQSTLEVIKDYRILFQLAQSQTELGEVEQAQKNCEQALELCPPENQEKKDEINYHYASILLDRGDVKKAKKLYQQILKRTHNDKLKARLLGELAEICTREVKFQEAIDKYKQIQKIYQDISDCFGEAATLHQLAGVYSQQGKLDEAQELYSQSLAIKEDIGDIKGQATTLYTLAGINIAQGLTIEAIELYEKCLGIQREIGHRQGEAATLLALAEICAQCEPEFVKKAIEYCQEALEIYHNICNPLGEAETLRQLAIIYFQQGQLRKAIKYCKQSLKIENRINSILSKSRTLSLLRQLLLSKQEQSPGL